VKIEFKMFENLFKMDLKKQKKTAPPLLSYPRPTPLPPFFPPTAHSSPGPVKPAGPPHPLLSLSLTGRRATTAGPSSTSRCPPFLPLVPAAGLSRRPRPPCAPPPPPLRHEGGAATHSTASSPLPLPKTNIAPSPWPLMAGRHRPHRL
jgi:hypothetical protein